VAFTGVIEIDGREYSEADMNGFTGDVDARFARDGYRILFVADKYQVGFDEPRLSGLLNNKNLGEPSSLVQTYSRVNRTTPGKIKTIIIDFVNSPEEVYDAFAIYRQGTNLQQETITLEELDRDIEKIQIIRQEDISTFSALCQPGSAPQHSDLASIFNPIAVRYRNLLQRENISEAEEISLREFPRLLRQRVRVYRLQKQTAGFEDSAEQAIIDLFYDYLGQILKAQRDRPEQIVLDEKISLESYNIFFADQSAGDEGGAGEQKAPLNGGEVKPRKTYLQDLLSALNRQYSADPEYEFWVRQLISEVSDDPVIIEQAVANSRQAFIGSPELKRSISNAVVSISGQVDVYKNYLQAMDGKEIPIIAGAVYDQLSGDVLGQSEQS
jgi:type I restriction enzyme R subunit